MPKTKQVDEVEVTGKKLERFAPSGNLQVVFLLDITGSMSSQIEGVKQMIRKFCERQQSGIDIHVWTFTEDGSHCYVVVSPEGLSGQDLISYVDSIRLCQPPGLPHISASGGDGPENYKAAVVTLKEIFGSGHNVLAFLIADNDPHYVSRPGHDSSEARAEILWLQSIGYQDPDSYYLLNQVIESINVTIVPILYGQAKRTRWFHQAAALTDGIILSPKSNDASRLAQGLFAILSATQSSIQNSTAFSDINFGEECSGFEICSLGEDFEILDREPEAAFELDQVYTSDPALVSMAVKGLIATAFDRFRGKKATRRCRAVDPSIVAASVKLLATTVLFKSAESKLNISAADIERAVGELRERLQEKPEPTTEYEIKLLEKYFSKEALEETAQLTGDSSQIQCIISQDSAMEGIVSLTTDPRSTEDVTKLVEVILGSTMCRLFQISFPLDARGDADFMDAWSSVVKAGSLSSVLSSASAMTLRDPVEGTFLDPLDRKAYNVALILAHPNDQVLSQVFQLLTSLPSLYGLVQGYLVSGGLRIFPSLGPGLQASSLYALANNFGQPEYSKTISQSEWELARQIVYSIHINNASIAGDVVSQLIKTGTLNPADGVSKLIAAYIRVRKLGNSDEVHLLRIFDELSAGRIAEISRLRRTIEDFLIDFPSDKDIMDCLIPDIKIFNPMVAYHPAEIATATGSGYTLTAQDFQRLAPLVVNTATYARFINSFEKLCTFIFSDFFNPGTALTLPPNFPTNEILLERFILSTLLGKRKNRYALESEGNWRLLDNAEVLKNATEEFLKIVSNGYSKDFSRWNAERLSQAKAQLVSSIASIPANTPSEECIAALTNANVSILEKNYRLQRSDVIQILESLQDSQLRTLGFIAVTGAWISEPSCQLRRSWKIICDRFESAGLNDLVPEITQEVMKASQCARATPPNRHGHTIDFQYPGPYGWTQEYEDRQLTAPKKPIAMRTRLALMKQFRLCGEEILEKCDNNQYSKNQEALLRFAVQSFEAPYEAKLKEIWTKVVDLKLLSETKYDEIVESRIKTLSEKNRQPSRLIKFLDKIGKQ